MRKCPEPDCCGASLSHSRIRLDARRRTILFCLAFLVSRWSFPQVGNDDLPRRVGAVRFIPILNSKEYPQASQPGALAFACAPEKLLLQTFFINSKLPFDPDLVRDIEELKCHIYFEPTLRGFRADPDDLPVSELFFDIDTLSYLSRRSARVGDSLDIAKTILANVSRPLTVHLGVEKVHKGKWYDLARDCHFPGSVHRILHRESRSSISNPWVQDYLKSGRVGDQPKILVTRYTYEGDADIGNAFQPLLSSFSDERYVRSKLSWEGGDLQFVRSPKDPGKLILLFGLSGIRYLNPIVTNEEFAYLLKLEFGADIMVDFSDLLSHVDYFVTFVPKANIALVSEPVLGNYELARDAIERLKTRFPFARTWNDLSLSRISNFSSEEFRKDKDRIHRALGDAKGTEWPARKDPVLADRLARYIKTRCPDQPVECMSLKGTNTMLEEDIPLLADWITDGLNVLGNRLAPGRLLYLVESQLPGFKTNRRIRVDAKIAVLRKLGFQVIRAPRIVGNADRSVPWTGISYVNSLLVDNLLFVPQYGLGPSENALIEVLQSRLPAPYRIVPVFAQRSLLLNGGIHCSVAVVRKSSDGD